MAILHSALCIFQSLLGFGSKKRSHNGTDWLKLALVVAAQPEDDECRSVVRTALQSNNQEFLDYLRSTLDTRSSAAARVAQINEEGIECRAFLPGSPALWGWTTNSTAEAAVLQNGIEAAMQSSVFDSPSTSCNEGGEDVSGGIASSETMGGATLRDIYAKAWELHREPLIWTPRPPSAGVGESTWMLTPVSLTLPSAQTRTRRASDASDARSSIIGMSPCLYAQRNRLRRDSLRDTFMNAETRQKGLASPFVETGKVTPSPPQSTGMLPPLELDSPPSRPRRSVSCTRSHVSSTTAVTVSECSTAQELQGLGLGLSLGGSTCSRPSTPSDFSFGENEVGKETAPKGRKISYHLLGGRSRAPGGAMSRRHDASGRIIGDNTKQPKLRRPGVTPLQRVQASIPKRVLPIHGIARTASASRALGNGSSRAHDLPIDGIIAGAQGQASSNSRDKFTPLRRVQSAAMMTLSPSPQLPRIVAPKVPLLGSVPAAKRALNKHGINNPLSLSTESRPNKHSRSEQVVALRRSSYQAPRLISAPPTQQASRATPRTPSMTQTRIPRPISRASLEIGHARKPSIRTASPSPKPEPQQLQTPASATCARGQTNFSQFSRPATSGTVARARSQTASSMRERPSITKDVRLSRPPSRAHGVVNPTHRSKRSNSLASASTMVDRWMTMDESFDTPVFA